MRIDRDRLLERLARAGYHAEVLALAPGIDLVVSSYGGRIHGPFFDGVDQRGWVSDAFASDEALAVLIASGDWNIGGQRLWLSPELDFFVGDRARFWETFSVPNALDPGEHRLSRDGATVVIRQSLSLANLEARIERRISAMPGEGVSADPRIGAYRHEIEIVMPAGSAVAVPWIIEQVEPDGRAMIPVDRGTKAVAMFGAPPADILAERDGAIRMPVAADSTFKIAVPAGSSAGLLGYGHTAKEGGYALAYRFSHDRNGVYRDEPPSAPGVNGFSSFVFQDDGSMGRYGELEVVGLELDATAGGDRRSGLVLDVRALMGEPDDAMAALDRWLAR